MRFKAVTALLCFNLVKHCYSSDVLGNSVAFLDPNYQFEHLNDVDAKLVLERRPINEILLKPTDAALSYVYVTVTETVTVNPTNVSSTTTAAFTKEVTTNAPSFASPQPATNSLNYTKKRFPIVTTPVMFNAANVNSNDADYLIIGSNRGVDLKAPSPLLGMNKTNDSSIVGNVTTVRDSAADRNYSSTYNTNTTTTTDDIFTYESSAVIDAIHSWRSFWNLFLLSMVILG